MYVYFIRERGVSGGPVKIGTATFPEKRLADFSRSGPVPLEIVATIPGALDLEMRFHSEFREQHSHGEWFRSSPALEATILSVQAGTFNPAILPDEGMRISQANAPWSEPKRRMYKLYHLVKRRLERRGFAVPPGLHSEIATFRSVGEAERVALEAKVATLVEAAERAQTGRAA